MPDDLRQRIKAWIDEYTATSSILWCDVDGPDDEVQHDVRGTFPADLTSARRTRNTAYWTVPHSVPRVCRDRSGRVVGRVSSGFGGPITGY
jgi:hypothetical protein